MGERETLTAPAVSGRWQRELKPVLNTYLRRVGISSPQVRERWVEYVFSGLQMHLEEFAAADIAEQAVERLRGAIDTRLARLTGLDPVQERRQIAGVLALLGDDRYADLVNSLFEDVNAAVDPEVRAQLHQAIARDRPQPVPAPAPLAMPEQTIELRSLRALLRRLRGAE